MKTIVKLLLAIVVALGFAAAGAAELINGVHSTGPYPLYSKWFYAHAKTTGVKINYQSIGSGGGIQQVKAGTVDFGASDAPLLREDLEKNNMVQFPMVAGAVAMIYNIPGIPSGLKLTSEIIADIYLGKITKWSDKRIREINPGLKMPDLPIIVAHRSDGSGTTNIFTWFLSDVSSEWSKNVGSATSVNW